MRNILKFVLNLKRGLFLLITGSFLITILAGALLAEGQDKAHKILFFAAPGCHKCEKLEISLNAVIGKYFKGEVEVDHKDISKIDNYKLYFSLLSEEEMKTRTTFPALYLQGRFISTNPDPIALRAEIAKAIGLKTPAEALAPKGKDVDMVSYFKKAGPLVIMGAGFIDGINPCAFTVIIFFMSFLTSQGYTRKKIIVSGLSFIGASFITYTLIGAGFFGGFHSLAMFKHVAAIINISIGALSLVFGALSLYDGIKFARTGSLDMLTLQLPRYLKTKIHNIIGTKYRKSGREGESHETRIWGAFIAAVVTGFLVSLFESACTGQVYLPTIVLILKTAGSPLLAFFYLIVYNLMFIIPLLIVFGAGMAGVSAEIFTKFTRRHMVKIKFIMAAIFFILGIMLIVSYMPHIAVANAAESAVPAENQVKAEDAYGEVMWDFGTVKECDILKHTFILKNPTDKTITIKQVNSSCGCTTYKLAAWTIEPGKSTTVDVIFDTKGYPGERHRYVYVHSDDPKNSIIMLEVKAIIK
jgi:thiol-disulfide isomerase/thioredoxin